MKTKTPKKKPAAVLKDKAGKTPKAAAPVPFAEGKRQSIDTSLIDPHPHNRKITPDSCKGLAASMRHGQIQPATVRPHPDKKGRFQLGAGGRRFVAAKMNGQPLDCIVRDLSDREIEAMLAVENLQREAPEPREEAAQIRRLFQLPDSTPQSVASILGKDEGWVKRRMRLLDLIDPVHELWQDPDSDCHHLSIASMELIAALTPEQQMALKEELLEDQYNAPSHKDVVNWIASMGCSLKDVKWLDEPATFIPGCGPACASSSAAADLFSQTEFADQKKLQCAQCLNPACFNKRKDLARAHAWQTVIARAPKGWHAISDRYGEHLKIELPDQSTVTARRKWDFADWKACKKTDPAAKPFLVEEDDAVRLTWKAPPQNASAKDLAATGEAVVKTPEDSRQASIDRLQSKRYELVLKELTTHVEKAPMPAFDLAPLHLASLAAAFGTSHTRSTLSHYEWQNTTPANDADDDDLDDEAADEAADTPKPTLWDAYREGVAPGAGAGHMLVKLWQSVRTVLLTRLRDPAHTRRKCDLILPQFLGELAEVAQLTGFDMTASYLRAATACKPPATLKDLDPVTLEKKS